MSLTSDDAQLARLGYKQEFKRHFTPLEVFGLSFSIIGIFPSIASVLVYALPNGGPVALVWGWAVCSVFLMFITMALAELGSAAPTSGGLYYWTHKFAPERCKNLLAWICAYSNTIGNIASVASVDWGCALQLMAAVSIGTDMAFVPTTGQTFGLYAALLCCHGVVASMATKVLARMQKVCIALNVLLCLAIIIAVPAATPTEFKNTARYAFGGFANLYGWPNGFAFILSFLAPLWTIGAFDSSVHISEEATNANIAVPWAMMGACAIAGVLGWGINVALAFCMGTDIAGIMSNPIGQPMATILFNSLGKKGTLAVWSIVVFVQFTMGADMATTCSRQIFAFSRDGGLPLSRYLYRMNRHTHTPVNCVWFACAVALLLGLLAFAGPLAIGAIFTLVVTGQYVAYSIPIACRFLGGAPWAPGPFSLVRLGLPVALAALAWMAFSIAILVFPTTPAPTAADMNYTVVVMGGWLLLCVAYYYLPRYGGVHWFVGPVANVVVPAASDAASETEKDAADRYGETFERG
ncbi:hypothetical protein PHLGIDRAFT_29863 [Phlebiopsis gigantea 11061_1 CR5-6]|uniref:Amino acid permease/ SLC12A domain-containing protein n=1 Tax=Phlebiopsis gigantea (strain 11061_1 CR5-6) TaxID=745531 RepID=A0A0C3PMH8_PHLG1|nr:hypothetical protein PHLGIDRAFT_29863 [Phlebiopsis gigantea 11061_1 CR5-6]